MAGGALPLAAGGAMVRYPRSLAATLCAAVMSVSAFLKEYVASAKGDRVSHQITCVVPTVSSA
jgi:hypothetical protein